MNMKRFATYILTTSLLTTSAIISPEAFAMPESLEKRTTENLGNNLVSDFVSEDGFIFTKNNQGDPILIVIAKGEKGEYNFVDLKTGENLKHGVANPDLDVTVRSWTGTVAEDGTVYLTDNNGFIYRANPNTLSFEVLPKPKFIKGEFAFWDAVTGDNGWMYFAASHPSGGRIVGYNHNTQEWKDFGVIYPGAIYVRSIAYDNGKIYAGTGSGEFTETFEIDAANPQNKTKLPKQDVYPNANTPGNSYMLTAHDGYLYIGHAGSQLGGHYVWDIKNKKYTDLIPNSGVDNAINSRIVASPTDNTIIYNGKDNKLYKYNPTTKKTTQFTESRSPLAINKTSFIDNDHIAGFQKDGGEIQIRSTKDTNVQTLKNEKNGDTRMLYPTVTMINALGPSIKDHILIGGAGGTSMWNINDAQTKDQIINNTELIKQRNGETKLIDNVGQNVLYVQYPNSVMVRIKDISTGDYDAFGLGSKDKLSLMRPLNSLPLDNDRIAITSTPNYGEYTGTLTIYNATTNQIEKNYQVDGLIPTAIAYDGKDTLYVGTSVRGEHADSNNRPEESAYILKINTKTHEIKKYKPFGNNPQSISAVAFDDKGRLFAYSADILMQLNPQDLSVIKQHDFKEHKVTRYSDNLTYSPQHKGFIAVMDSNIYWIDPDDITQRDKLDEGLKTVIAESGNIYYNKNNRVHRVIPYASQEDSSPSEKTDPSTSTQPSSSTPDVPSSESDTSTNTPPVSNEDSTTGQTSPTTPTVQPQTPETTSISPTDGSETTMPTQPSEPSINVSESDIVDPKTTNENTKTTNNTFPRDDDHATFKSTARDHEDTQQRSRTNNAENNGSKVITNDKQITQPTINKDSTNPSRVNTPPVIPTPAVPANTPLTHGNAGPTVATGGSIKKSFIHKIKMFLSQ